MMKGKKPSKPQTKSTKKFAEPASQEVRLNKYIANSGVCSRREADTLIAGGEIKVNGQVITELGYKVQRSDKVQYKGKTLISEKFQYVLLNKPTDFITTMSDPKERKTVMSLVKTACEERIYPVGRLDRATTGLLLFTNDGDLAKKLTHPSYNIKKIYQVTLDRAIENRDFDTILAGVKLEDGVATPDEMAVVSDDKTVLGIEIHIGKNRIVRRIFEHFGYKVVKLDRVMFGPLTKQKLSRGKFRHLTPTEVMSLKNMTKNKKGA